MASFDTYERRACDQIRTGLFIVAVVLFFTLAIVGFIGFRQLSDRTALNEARTDISNLRAENDSLRHSINKVLWASERKENLLRIQLLDAQLRERD